MQLPKNNESRQTGRSKLGFGLERIGIVALRHPGIAGILLLLSFIVSVVVIPNGRFDGNVINVVNQQSQAYRDYDFQNRNFRNFVGDTWLIVSTPRLATAAGMEALRSLHLDLTLEDNVESVFSVFSLGDISAGVSSFKPLVPDRIDSDEQARQVLAEILQQRPAASAIIAPDNNAAILNVSLQKDSVKSDNGLDKILVQLRSAAKDLSPPDFDIIMSGYPAIRMAIVDAIISDQTVLTVAGIAIGAIVALIVFGNLVSALICTIPPVIAVAWLLAAFSLTGVKLNFLTTVLPTLALIIAFADSIVIYFRWQALNKENGEGMSNLEEALWQVGPASSLTSITTALAFLSFIWASSASMTSFALFGMAAVILAFIAVIAGLPVACYWLAKLFRLGSGSREPAFLSFGKVVANNAVKKPSAVIVGSLIMLAGLVWVHFQLQPSYETNTHLPYDSEIRKAEVFTDKAFGGSSQYLIILPVSEGGTFFDEVNRQRLAEVTAIVARQFGPKRTLSLDEVWKATKPDHISKIAADLLASPPSTRGRFLAYDARSMMVLAQVSSRANTRLVTADAERLKTQFSHLSYADQIRITGMPVLLASEFPVLINQLRTGLLFAVVLAIGVVGLAARSFSLAFATLVPNLLPLLFAESVVWFMGNNLDITNIIALTIAFGIAIDNAVHVINSYLNEKSHNKTPESALRSALIEISPALLASTVIVCVAAIITQLSVLPSINTLGRLMIITLIMALVTNLVVLPAYLLFMSKFKPVASMRANKET